MKQTIQGIQTYGTKEIAVYGHKRLCYLIKCDFCEELHYKDQYELLRGIGRNKRFFCSRECMSEYRRTTQNIECAFCGTLFYRKPSQRRGKHAFCSQSCAASYNNRHKTHGTNRSKQEVHIECKLKEHFPNLEVMCNINTVIGSELDFYFPILKIAIQINGIYHFEPIHGQDRLTKIQRMDQEKRIRCSELNIRLVEIDCGGDRYLTEEIKNKRWEQIKTILEEVGAIEAQAF